MFLVWRKRRARVRPSIQAGEWRAAEYANFRAWQINLVEGRRVNSKPKQFHLATLGSISDFDLYDAKVLAGFWTKVRTRLDGLGDRLTRAERTRFEVEISTRVPSKAKPLPNAQVLASAQKLLKRAEHHTLRDMIQQTDPSDW